MRRQLELFFIALGFFTRLPVPAWVGWAPEQLTQATRYFPLVGWVVGGLVAAGYLLIAQILPPSLAVVLSTALGIRLTGAFHEDGLADTCDGLGGGWDKAQALTIMKDSRLGSYGAIGLTLMLLAKAVALIELGGDADGDVALALLVAHPLSRLAATVVMHLLPYVRADDSAKSRAVARPLAPADLAVATGCGLLPLLLLAPLEALGALLAAAAATLWLIRLFLRRLGGHTGDCLGAVQQAAELACYLGILAAWNYT